ncbi:TrmB family transcriptional regulator [Streptomyces chilikensis]|uniref:TrmB family transcriptional regulator n=1 Tax=Streptomyces chilikensis TaxID=1194079 RepID=UPI000A807E83|nr:TrmB family transcriptional regulator [Streptomyces chilikensis]
MSKSTTADRLEGLAPAVIAVYTQLVAFTEPATVDQVAQTAETPRSSTFKALTALEKRGLAQRERGVQFGPKRCPDIWSAVHEESPTPASAPGELGGKNEPVESVCAESPAGVGTSAETVVEVPPQQEETVSEPASVALVAAVLPAQGLYGPRAVQAGPTGPGSETVVAGARGGSGRLAHGGLRQLVIEHLTAHPGEAFTATRIGRVLERSSGAVANALVTLTKQGRAEQVTERPRTYRAVLPDQAA